LPRLKPRLHLRNATLLIKPLRPNWVIVNPVGLGVIGAIARREGPVIVRRVARAGMIVVRAAAVKVAVVKAGHAPKAGQVAAVDGPTKDSRRLN
jgi:hypothetical protein